MKPTIPENLNLLHTEEERLRLVSTEATTASEEFRAHAEMIEGAMDLISYFVWHYATKDEDMLAIQLLGIRLFNAAASALKLLLSGYYQTSALQQRDMLETIFLLGYFSTDSALVTRWRTCDGKVRQKEFGPAVVRKALDRRDEFTEGKRGKTYKLMCELAGHANPQGFRMLTPTPGGKANLGPFFEATMFKAVYEELAKQLAQAAAAFTRLFKAASRTDYQTKIRFMEIQGKWIERFYGHSFGRTSIDELAALMRELERCAEERR